MARQEPGKSNSIEKALGILMAFVPYNQEMGTTEISRKLGLHKATANRVLRILTKKGFLQQNPGSRKFMLGEAALQVGNAVSRSLRSSLVPIAKPYMDRLRERLGETVCMEVLIGVNSIMAYVADGPQPVRVAAAVGELLPKHAAAGAKAVLAFSSPEVRTRCINGELPRLTDNTITDPDDYHRHLADVRRQGWAIDREEIEIGLNAVGVPVFDFRDLPVAALVVVGPSVRVPGPDPRGLLAALRKTAGRIAENLHYAGDFYRT